MKIVRTLAFRRNRQRRILLLFVVLVGFFAHQDRAFGGKPLPTSNFKQIAPQGFGDRQNSWAWAMQWWRGHLYVGTNRAYRCVEAASLHITFPDFYPYPPPPDPDVDCTDNVSDLPLQAEIWRWTPSSSGVQGPGSWERMYQAPPLAGTQGIGRDIGYRGMTVFKDPDGTEALYVGSISPSWIGYNVPPRILRSEDGITFEAVPQKSGTFLGDFKFSSFRNLTSYKGRFYIQGGSPLGDGPLLEATNPAGGNNNFRDVSPPNKRVSAVGVFNGFLYLGITDFVNGYAVMKTNAEGSLPYAYTTIVDYGGYLDKGGGDARRTNKEVLSMQVFNNRLYVGGNGVPNPAELIRVNPNDTWDLVVGEPRLTPAGQKDPLSGLGAGFGWSYNQHMWRMAVFDDNLYVGTFDNSIGLKNDPTTPTDVRKKMGFDLYTTSDGVNFTPITTNGFGEKYSYGVRSLESTPYGLFLGSANHYYGLQMWRATSKNFKGFKTYAPLIEAMR